MTVPRALSAELRHGRMVAQLTQSEAAEKAGMARSTYAHYEAHPMRGTVATFAAICAAIGRTPADVFASAARPRPETR